MKPKYVLLLSFIAGLTGGYLAAPELVTMLTQHLQAQAEKMASTATGTPEQTTDTTDYGELIGLTPAKGSSRPGTQPRKDEPSPEDITEHYEDSVVLEEEDDPEGENTTPTGIATYTPKHKPNAEDESSKPFREQKYTGKLTTANWRNPKQLKRTLATKLRSRLKDVDQQSVEEFLKDPEVRLMLSQWELLNRSNLDVLAKLMHDERSAKALEPMLNNLEWVSGFVYDGELEQAEIALSMIAHFAQVDPNMSKDPDIEGQPHSPWLKRRVAGAIATQFTRNQWYGELRPLSKEEKAELKKLGYHMPALPDGSRNKGKKDIFRDARERYLFFAESIDKGLLHSQFGALPTWQLHFVCGWGDIGGFGTATTMRWLRDNCAAPASAYTGMYSQVPYLATNMYGDSIHSEWYYQPFDALYPGNFAKEVRDVGSVCWGLSSFGASAACSYGVPAITVFEPGHLAYAVYFDGKWHPANSGAIEDQQRHPDYNIWGTNTWLALQMQTDMYKQGAITRDAQLVISMAGIMQDCRNPNNALALFEMAAQMQPLYRPIWALYMSSATAALKRQPRRWLGVNDFLCKSLTPQEPHYCANLLLQIVYPGMLKTLRSPKQKLEAFESFFRNLKTNSKDKWDTDELLNTQYQALGKAAIYKKHYMQMLVEHVAKAPEFNIMFVWAMKTAIHEGKVMRREVLEMIQNAISTHPAAKDHLSAAVIRAAEECGDMELANEWSKDYVSPALPNAPASAGALVMLSTYPIDDNLASLKHAEAVSGGVGLISTNDEWDASMSKNNDTKGQSVTLVFPKRTHVARIEIIPGGLHLSKWGYLILEISKDGEKWEPFLELDETESAKDHLDISITKNQPVVRYLRISDVGMRGPSQINFRAIRVYDKIHTK